MTIRPITTEDREAWSQLRTEPWPDTEDNHLAEIDDYFAHQSPDIDMVFVAEDDMQKVVGSIELNIREFAEGSRHPRVPYVEGWCVDKASRNKGYGKQLMAVAEQWAKANGYIELASDTEISNTRSISIHKHLGYREVERIVCFIKRIPD